ncbi:restriction endonuclease subunit S [Antarcticibacterium flavum]|uniref:Restriction endonuclease subunit S n=2 Tax=Flavobacteriaceae TaxID=49546 RepID=A0A5B7X9E6_9FLAO|nr:restriction endonuclease subunit S [Antarcticibacterium sp. W02-3]QCY71422.1 restriction endonuclease subunit S [Antarcticibacterium flavum]
MCKRILKKQTTTEGGVPFYKIGTFGKEPNAFIPEEIYNEFRSKYSFPKKGDILISASGTIGRRVVYDGEPAYFQDSNIVWIDNDESEVLNEFLYEFYGVCNWNPSKGATIARLYNDDLRRIKISYPPIEKQKAIVPAIRELKKKTKNIADQYRMKQKNLEELKKSLLEKGFKGELIKEEVTYED